MEGVKAKNDLFIPGARRRNLRRESVRIRREKQKKEAATIKLGEFCPYKLNAAPAAPIPKERNEEASGGKSR